MAELDRSVLGSPALTGAADDPAKRLESGAPLPTPLAVWAAISCSVATWVVIAIWPPPIYHDLFIAVIAGWLGAGALARWRWCYWLLIALTLAKVAGDMSFYSDDGVTLTVVSLVLDLAALTLLGLPATRRRTRRPPRPVVEIDGVLAVPVDGSVTVPVEWTPRIADWERAFRIQRRLAGRVWLWWAGGGLLTLVSLPGAFSTDPVSIVFACLGVLIATGWYPRLYRLFFFWPRRRTLLQPRITTLSADGVRTTTARTDARVDWEHWPAYAVTRDLILLLSSSGRRRVQVLPLPRHGVASAHEWKVLQGMIQHRLTRHPAADRATSRDG